MFYKDFCKTCSISTIVVNDTIAIYVGTLKSF